VAPEDELITPAVLQRAASTRIEEVEEPPPLRLEA
jgi:hypothetical protein